MKKAKAPSNVSNEQFLLKRSCICAPEVRIVFSFVLLCLFATKQK